MRIIFVLETMIRLLALSWVDIRRGRILALLFLLLALHVAVLALCADPTFPLWSSWVIPLFRWRFGEAYLHYPQALIGLPATGSAMRVVVDLVVGPWVALWCGGAVLASIQRHTASDFKLARRASASYAHAFLFVLVVIGIWILLYTLPLSILLKGGLIPYKLRQLVAYGLGVVPIVVQSTLFYVLALIVTDDAGFLGAARRSFGRFRQNPLLAICVSAVPYGVGIPFAMGLHRSAEIADRLRPELVLVLMGVESLLAILAGFYVLDSSVRLWLKPKELR